MRALSIIMSPRRLAVAAALCTVGLTALVGARPQTEPTGPMNIGEIRPGMTGVGRTVFDGTRVEEFKVNILGVLENVIGTRRNLILARLEGGPLAATGVILTLTVNRNSGVETRTGTIDLTPLTGEAVGQRVLRRFPGSVCVSNANWVTFTIGDGAAVSNTWQIDRLVVSWVKGAPVAA